MPVAFLRQGCSLLPGIKKISEILHTAEAIPIKTKTLAPDDTLGLTNRCGLLPPDDLDSLKVGRIIRKTSEQQSRWLIKAGCETWQRLYGEQAGGTHTGLFAGLATIACDDDKHVYCFKNPKRKAIAATLLRKTRPLAGLALLNTTACSHLATQLQITGPNAAFSPHADAGAAALTEAYFNVLEGNCARALCGAGSQKITPLYFLAYESLLKKFAATPWFPTESAAFIGIDSVYGTADGIPPDGILIDTLRAFGSEKKHRLPAIDKLLARLRVNNRNLPEQVIHTGTVSYSDTLRVLTASHLPTANQFFIDTMTGYTGPASVLLAVNLTLEIFKQGIALDQHKTVKKIAQAPQTSALIIAQGLEGQVNYLLVGKAP